MRRLPRYKSWRRAGRLNEERYADVVSLSIRTPVLARPHDKWRGHQSGVMSRPGPVEMRTRSDIPVLLTAPAIDLRASLSDNARDGRAPNSRQTQTGKYVGVPVIFAG